MFKSTYAAFRSATNNYFGNQLICQLFIRLFDLLWGSEISVIRRFFTKFEQGQAKTVPAKNFWIEHITEKDGYSSANAKCIFFLLFWH